MEGMTKYFFHYENRWMIRTTSAFNCICFLAYSEFISKPKKKNNSQIQITIEHNNFQNTETTWATTYLVTIGQHIRIIKTWRQHGMPKICYKKNCMKHIIWVHQTNNLFLFIWKQAVPNVQDYIIYAEKATKVPGLPLLVRS